MIAFKNNWRILAFLLSWLIFQSTALSQAGSNTIAGALSSSVLSKETQQVVFINLIPQPSSPAEHSAQYCFTVASINGAMEVRALATSGELNLFAVPALSSTSACIPRLIKLIVKCIDGSYDCEYRYRIDRF
ncbi:MAG: hypothetical protein ACQ9MH_20935 [Nitrospinales bacterium]